jgi:hypothetical protein
MKKLLISLIVLSLSSFVFGQERKKITNSDLEEFKQKRIKAEEDYRKNYKRLGMPSPEELEQREAERQQRLAEFSRQATENQRQNENYWQSQARNLRSEIANLDAQISILRQQISRVPNQQPVIYSYGYYSPNYYPQSPQIQTRPIYGSSPNSRIILNNRVQNPPNQQNYGNINVNVDINRRRSHGNINYNYGNYYGNYVYPLQNQNYQRDELISRLRYLEQQRAGLLAQWNLLEDEARKNGVRIDY